MLYKCVVFVGILAFSGEITTSNTGDICVPITSPVNDLGDIIYEAVALATTTDSV